MKLDLEQIIIGTVVLCNRYSMVGHILSPANFTVTKTVDYRLIWHSIVEMHERLEPLDIITLTHYINKYHGKSYGKYITRCTNRVSSDANLKFHAIVLLELDIKQKVTALLTNHITELQNVPVARASAIEVMEILKSPDSDVFEVLDGAITYLKSIFYPEMQYNQLLAIKEAIPEKVKKIKELRHVEELFKKISRIPDLTVSPKADIALKQVVDLVHNLVWKHTTEIDKVINKLTEINEIYG